MVKNIRMSRGIRRLAIALGAILMVAALVILVFYRAGGEGSGLVEGLIRRVVEQAVSRWIVPDLKIEVLDYQYPRTMVVNGVQLVAQTDGGEKVPILSVRRLQVTLTAIPARGEPIDLESFSVEGGEFRLVSIEPGSRHPVGYSNLIRWEEDGEAESKQEVPFELSPLPTIRNLELKDVSVVFDSRLPETQPVRLDGIHSSMKLQPEEGGWYHLQASINRDPIFDFGIDGRLQLDPLELELEVIDLEAEFSRAWDSSLPPQLQQWLRRHEVTGKASINGNLNLRFGEPRRAAMALEIELGDAYAVLGENKLDIPAMALSATGEKWPGEPLFFELTVAPSALTTPEYRFAIESLNAVAHLRKDHLQLTSLDLGLLDGSLTASGMVPFDSQERASLQVAVAGVKIQGLLDPVQGEEGDLAPPEFAGTVDLILSAEASRDAWSREASGEGKIQVSEGHFANLPLFSAIANFLGNTTDKVSKKKEDRSPLRDRMEAQFSLEGDRIHFSRIDAVTSVIAATGNGDIFFDQRLDLVISAGFVNKVLRHIPLLRTVVTGVTDQIRYYKVGGRIQSPEVKVRPLRLLTDRKDKTAGKKEDNAAEESDTDSGLPE